MKWIIIGLVLLNIFFILKIILLKKSVREFRTDFSARLKGDSNSLITVNTRDKDICMLASQANESLKELRKNYMLYHQGDAEMKNAITNISHDLRTPLTAITGYLELLKPLEKSSEVERYLGIIEERSKHMRKLTEEMFEYSVITSTEDEEIPLEPVNLNRAIEDCIMDYYGALTEKKINLEVDITENKIVRNLNKAKLDRVFSNLISNAIKYSDGDLKISLDDNGTVIFSNTAKNLSSVSVERLFGRFYTVENARHSTGVGLSIAKNFVERMNGTITAEYKTERLYIILTFS